MDNERLDELEQIYILMYVNLYDDNLLHAELSLHNNHAGTEAELETLIKDFIRREIEMGCTKQEIEEECGIDINTLRIIK